MTQFPIENKKIKLAMLGMTEGNGHPYSWSIIINGRYNAEALAQCPYAAIIDYISKQPKNTIGIKDVEVSHVWTDNPCLLYTSPSPRDGLLSRMPSSA